MKATRFAYAIALAAALVSSATSSPASAAPCAGFNDVDDASSFCGGVAWLRNRGITNGCATNAFCPDRQITRLEMAAFFSRMDRVLPPTVVDSTGRALGALSEIIIGPSWVVVFRRAGGEVHRLALFRGASLNLVSYPLYYELPGCTGKAYADPATPPGPVAALRSHGSVATAADGTLLLYASAPYAQASSVATMSYRSGTGDCTIAAATGNLIEVAFVESLGYHWDEAFEVR